jgi:Flp pilus assembly protein TadG
MRSWFKFLREERAVVAVTTAVLMPALILFMALGVEVGEWYATDRHMQTVADTAAIAAAIELANGGTVSYATKADWSATLNESNGFGGSPTITCLSSIDPDVSEACTSTTIWSTGYVSAIVTASQPTVFAHAFAPSVTVGAKAVASWTQPYQACGLALASSGTAISTSGSPTISLGTNCVLASDSTGNDSLDLSAASAVAAQTLISAGGLNCPAKGCAPPAVTVVTGVVVDGPVTPDPFSCSLAANANLCSAETLPANCVALSSVSPPAGCYTDMTLGATFTGSIAGTTLTVTAVSKGSLLVGETITGAGVAAATISAFVTGTGGTGTYTISSPQTIGSEAMGATGSFTLSGIYYTEGNFEVMSGTTVTGNGVSIVFNTASCSASVGNIAFDANSTSTLVAPSAAGNLSGMLFVQLVPTGCTGSIAASATVTLAGNIYAPVAAWTISAAPTTTCLNGVACGGVANECLTLTTSSIAFDASVSLVGAGCTVPTGTNVHNVQTISLVE